MSTFSKDDDESDEIKMKCWQISVRNVRYITVQATWCCAPARLDWSIIGWTIRRRALINLSTQSHAVPL